MNTITGGLNCIWMCRENSVQGLQQGIHSTGPKSPSAGGGSGSRSLSTACVVLQTGGSTPQKADNAIAYRSLKSITPHVLVVTGISPPLPVDSRRLPCNPQALLGQLECVIFFSNTTRVGSGSYSTLLSGVGTRSSLLDQIVFVI